jgi:hypothetical protein
MSLPLIPTLLLLFTLSSTATSHYSSSNFSPSSSAPSQSPTLSEWQPARATFYAASDPRDTVGGACGFGDLKKAGYGMATVGLSETLFERGQICGACFQLRCVDDLRWCIPGTSIIVTATNFCAPNYGFTPDGGGRCNPPNKHFVLPIDAFEKIAIWKAGNMPVQYRRYSRTLPYHFPLTIMCARVESFLGDSLRLACVTETLRVVDCMRLSPKSLISHFVSGWLSLIFVGCYFTLSCPANMRSCTFTLPYTTFRLGRRCIWFANQP